MYFAHGQMLTLVSTTTTTDDYGDTTTVTTEAEWGPCAVAPRYATESVDPRVPPVIVGKVIYGPPPPHPIDSDDRIWLGETDERIAGDDKRVMYGVDGDDGEWKNPFTGWFPGVEVPVKRASAV